MSRKPYAVVAAAGLAVAEVAIAGDVDEGAAVGIRSAAAVVAAEGAAALAEAL